MHAAGGPRTPPQPMSDRTRRRIERIDSYAAQHPLDARKRGLIPFLRTVTPLFATLALVTAIHVFVPAYRTGHGQGTRGTFIAQRLVCGNSGYCEWHGVFVPSGDPARRSSVAYVGDTADYHVGSQIPTLHLGATDSVYPANGRTGWVTPLVAIVVSVLILLAWTWFVPVVSLLRRRRSRRDNWLVPTVGA